MKKAGIIGGLGPSSTLDYYRDIIAGFRMQAKTENNPLLVIDSVNIMEMLSYVSEGQYVKLARKLLESVENLASAGADFAAIASNTPHIAFDLLKEKSPLPLINIIEETCKESLQRRYKKVGVLGTKFTMSNGLYTNALERYGMKAVLPDEEDQNTVNQIIFPNLENGIVLPEEKEKMLGVIEKLVEESDVDAVILGCTELPLMILDEDSKVPLLNTTQIHIQAIIQKLLEA